MTYDRGGITVRVGTVEDAADCAAIFDDWVGATDWMPRVHPAEDVVRHYREHVFRQCAVAVAERHGRAVGFLARNGTWIEQLYLAPEARGLGVGGGLLAAAKAASPGGLTLWTFVANQGARRFYARAGFRELRRTAGENEEGLPDVLLGWL
jgi:GNAT superfamily N-acetyltransferase